MLLPPGQGPETELMPPTNPASRLQKKKSRLEAHRENIFDISDAQMKRYKCIGCNQSWPYPRDVAFLAGIPQDMRNEQKEPPPEKEHPPLSSFVPVSKDTLVAYQTWDRKTRLPHFREEIYARLKLTHSLLKLRKRDKLKSLLTCFGKLQYHRLVTEFDYNRKTGDVIHCSEFSNGEQEIDFRYARLITLNSWYIALVANFLNIIIDITSIATGVMMLGQLYSHGAGYDGLGSLKESKHFFCAWYFGCLTIALMLAARSARWEWKAHSSPSVGDIIIKCHRFDRVLSFVALTVFIFLGVDKLIKDIVKILHPWKSVHPHAAVKVEGVRVHVVGYKSRPLFHVENSSGQLGVLSVLAINKITTFIYTVWLIVVIKTTKQENLQIQGTLMMSTAVSLISAAVAIHKIAKLHRYRRLLKIELLRILRFAEERGDMARKAPARKLLALHFHQERIDGQANGQDGLRKLTSEQIRVSEKRECQKCGRAFPSEDARLSESSRVD